MFSHILVKIVHRFFEKALWVVLDVLFDRFWMVLGSCWGALVSLGTSFRIGIYRTDDVFQKNKGFRIFIRIGIYRMPFRNHPYLSHSHVLESIVFRRFSRVRFGPSF